MAVEITNAQLNRISTEFNCITAAYKKGGRKDFHHQHLFFYYHQKNLS